MCPRGCFVTLATCVSYFHGSCVLCSVFPIVGKPVEMGVFWDPEPELYLWVDVLQVGYIEEAN